MAGVGPAWRRSLWAAAADIPVTLGTVVYRPASSHQPSPAAITTAATARARYPSLRLNSSRCSRGSACAGYPAGGTAPVEGASPPATMRVLLGAGRYGAGTGCAVGAGP